MSDRSNIYVIALVAIVAVVGLVTLFVPGGDPEGVPAGDLVMDEDGNIVGEAFMLPAKYRTSAKRATRRSAALARVTRSAVPQCRDTDGGNDPMVKGEVRIDVGTYMFNGVSWPRSRFTVFSDHCSGPRTVVETVCPADKELIAYSVGTVHARFYTKMSCPFGTGCDDGRCVPLTQEILPEYKDEPIQVSEGKYEIKR